MQVRNNLPSLASSVISCVKLIDSAGTKRKMSTDRGGPTAGGSDIDPQLIGPGVPSGMSMDNEGPAPKRRSSAFDTRLAQLNLYERRNSVDSRGNGQPASATASAGASASAGGGGGGGSSSGNPQWWNSERRDSAATAAASTPMFANTPLTAGGYSSTPSSAFSGDSPHGRPPPGIATFAWPNPSGDQAQQAGSPPQNNEASMANNNPSPYDSNIAMLPPGPFAQNRRMSAPTISPENVSPSPSSGPARALRSRSRPPSRVRGSGQSGSAEESPGPSNSNAVQSDEFAQQTREPGSTPYSRSPELRVSHKLAERKRRKEMKDLFDELRDQLPADRGMKASKWEILSKGALRAALLVILRVFRQHSSSAIDFINNLKQSHQDMGREIDMLRHELDSYRSGIPPPFAPGGPVVYGHGPPVGVSPFPPPPGPGGPPPPGHLPPSQMQNAPPPTLPRPGSSQNVFPPGPPPPNQPPPNGTPNPVVTRADTTT